jgi:hypothetical protein
MQGQFSKKEQRKILKQLGVDFSKKKNLGDVSLSIEEGKNKHRMFVQEMKNREIMKNISSGINTTQQDSPANYLSEPQSYSQFNSFIISPNWGEE